MKAKDLIEEMKKQDPDKEAMKRELGIIRENLEATLEGFREAYEMEGYDLGNERHYVETALKRVNLLTPNVSNRENIMACFSNTQKKPRKILIFKNRQLLMKC